MFDGITLCDSGGLKNAMGSHAFVKYRHKYYDSEVLQGVYDYNELPGIAYTSKQLVIHTPDTFADDWASQAERFCISFDDMEDWAQSVLRSIANDS